MHVGHHRQAWPLDTAAGTQPGHKPRTPVEHHPGPDAYRAQPGIFLYRIEFAASAGSRTAIIRRQRT